MHLDVQVSERCQKVLGPWRVLVISGIKGVCELPDVSFLDPNSGPHDRVTSVFNCRAIFPAIGNVSSPFCSFHPSPLQPYDLPTEPLSPDIFRTRTVEILENTFLFASCH